MAELDTISTERLDMHLKFDLDVEILCTKFITDIGFFSCSVLCLPLSGALSAAT